MRRLFVVAGLSISLLAGCDAIPGLSGILGGDDYYPLIEGATWEYDALLNGAKAGSATVTTSLVTKASGSTTANQRVVLTLKASGGDTQEQVNEYQIKKLADEVQTSSSNGDVSVSLKLPLKQGLSWKSSGSECEVKSQEDISTPAGAYRGAWMIKEKTEAYDADTYFANGVGMVKSIQTWKNGNKITLELTKFSKP